MVGILRDFLPQPLGLIFGAWYFVENKTLKESTVSITLVSALRDQVTLGGIACLALWFLLHHPTPAHIHMHTHQGKCALWGRQLCTHGCSGSAGAPAGAIYMRLHSASWSSRVFCKRNTPL